MAKGDRTVAGRTRPLYSKGKTGDKLDNGITLLGTSWSLNSKSPQESAMSLSPADRITAFRAPLSTLPAARARLVARSRALPRLASPSIHRAVLAFLI